MGKKNKQPVNGINRSQITLAGLLLILLVISGSAILLLDIFYLQPYVTQMEWAAIREHAIKAEQAGQLDIRSHLNELSSLSFAWAQSPETLRVLDPKSPSGEHGPAMSGLARGDADLVWITDASGAVAGLWAGASKGSAVLFTREKLQNVSRDVGGSSALPYKGYCKIGNTLALVACNPVREKSSDQPRAYLWAARYVDSSRLARLGQAVKGQVVFVDTAICPKGVFFDDSGKPMVQFGSDRKLMLSWPVQDAAGRTLGFLSCALDATGLQGYSQAARRSILIVTTLCFGLAILTVVGSHMMITAPVVRLLMRLNRLLRSGYGTVDELKEGLHGEALVLAGQVGMAISRLAQTSRADPGTGLPNRRNFEEVLNAFYSQASRYRRPLSVMLLDVDHFKSINDKLGHLEGDEILRAVSRAIVAALRGADRPARLGGDEFAVILPETAAEQAAAVAERIRRSVEALDVPELGRTATVSIGVADLQSGPTDCPDDLLKLADKALYVVKDMGRNKVVFGRSSGGTFDPVAVETELAAQA